MADLVRKERLSPPLMYAFRTAHEARDSKKKLDLRDEGGERVIANRRTAARVAITEPTLRREVARDLDALMNTIAMESTQDLHEFEHVRKSVLNFGFPDIAHRSIDELSLDDVKYEIATVLTSYEPRLGAQYRAGDARHDRSTPPISRSASSSGRICSASR